MVWYYSFNKDKIIVDININNYCTDDHYKIKRSSLLNLDLKMAKNAPVRMLLLERYDINRIGFAKLGNILSTMCIVSLFGLRS